MASKTTAQAGALNDKNSWVGGALPAITDDVTITFAMTLSDNDALVYNSMLIATAAGNVAYGGVLGCSLSFGSQSGLSVSSGTAGITLTSTGFSNLFTLNGNITTTVSGSIGVNTTAINAFTINGKITAVDAGTTGAFVTGFVLVNGDIDGQGGSGLGFQSNPDGACEVHGKISNSTGAGSGVNATAMCVHFGDLTSGGSGAGITDANYIHITGNTSSTGTGKSFQNDLGAASVIWVAHSGEVNTGANDKATTTYRTFPDPSLVKRGVPYIRGELVGSYGQ